MGGSAVMGIRCGVDIADVKRIEHSLKSNGLFAAKVFTEGEIGYCESKKARKYESYAARFAAKEAFMKALGTGMLNGAGFTEIEVVNDAATGEPHLKLHGGAAKLYDQTNGASLSLSLSHTPETAIAMVAMLHGGPQNIIDE